MKKIAFLVLLFGTFAQYSFSAVTSLGSTGSFYCVASYSHDYPQGVKIGSPTTSAGEIQRALIFQDSVYDDVCVQERENITCKIDGYTISLNVIAKRDSYGNGLIDVESQKNTPSFQGQIIKDLDLPGGEHNSRIYCSMNR